MGNRAVIVTEGGTKRMGGDAPAIYLHWNGGPESVLAFLHAAKDLGVRSPDFDECYFMARFVQVIANFFGGTTSIGFGRASELDQIDNGLYVVGGDFEIVSRSRKGEATTFSDLGAGEREHYHDVRKQAYESSAPHMSHEDEPVNYDAFVTARWRGNDIPAGDMLHVTAGLSGEVGEVMEMIKKSIIPGLETPYEAAELALEIGDVLYYLSRLASMHGTTLEACKAGNIAKLTSRDGRGKDKVREIELMKKIMKGGSA